MPGPFPGVDPWLESRWGDVHTRLITYASDQLQPNLPSGLRAWIEEQVSIDVDWREARPITPDVRVVEHPRAFDTQIGASGIAVAEPLIISVPDEPETERFIEIRDTSSGGRVVTVVEILSPSNKRRGAGRDKYVRKREELHQAGVNTVEIDLLRTGPSVFDVPDSALPEGRRATYQACVWRAASPGAYEVYPMPLREPLSAIAVPLREYDEDAAIDLQALIDQCYDRGGYDIMDYAVEPSPPLNDDDARWAAELL